MTSLTESFGELKNGITGTIESIGGVVSNNPSAVIGSALVGGALVGATTAAIISRKKASSKSSRKKHKKITHTKRGLKQDRKRRSKQKWEVAYQKRKRKKKSHSRSRKGKHYTKNGQPYIILASGKARFVKK